MGRMSTVKRVFSTQGLSGVLAVVTQRYLDNSLGQKISWLYGKAIELRGNTVRMDGCTFSLDSPVITTESKSKFLFDQYEKPERQAIDRFLDPALPVVEFGGSIGVVSCLTNRKLRNPERHVVVEASPALVLLLRKNRDQNQCKFEILPRMVGYGTELGAFYLNKSNFVASTAVAGETNNGIEVLDVPTIDLRSILEQYQFDRCTLICDIEGGESDLLRYESQVIGDRVETLILEVHEWSLGKERVAELFGQLKDLGFRIVYSEAETFAFKKEGQHVVKNESTVVNELCQS